MFWLEDFLSWCSFDDECKPYLNSKNYFDGSTAGDGLNMRKIIHNFLELKAFTHYEADIIFSDIDHSYSSSSSTGQVVNGSQLITVSRAILNHNDVSSSRKKVDAMQKGYDTCEKSNFGLKKAFTYSEIYIFVTQCKCDREFMCS